MMLKSDRIAELLEEGSGPDVLDPLVIRPFPAVKELRKSGAASVDLRLGTWFVTLREARLAFLDVASSGRAASQLTKTHYVPFGNPFFLHPRAFVLSATLEWICLPRGLAAYVIGKSSWGRRGLIIATATGVHPGFKGCLTLELTNVGEIPIEIKPGMPICQLFIHRVEEGQLQEVDQSAFVGYRKPTLGTVTLDDIAQGLSDSKISAT
jgi:dCTP deaminase